jgi:cytochrome b561
LTLWAITLCITFADFVIAITLPSDASWQMSHGCSFNGTQKIVGLTLLFVVWVRVVQVQVTKKEDGLPSLGCLQNLISELCHFLPLKVGLRWPVSAIDTTNN